jgi:hypothetical protein
MNRNSRMLVVVALCGALLMPWTVPAADDVLTVVPDDVMAVVVINQVGQTQKKLEALGQQLQVPVADLLGAAKLTADAQPHIDPQGAAAIAVVPEADRPLPTVVGFIPTRDYAALLKQFQVDDATAKIATVTVGSTQVLVAKKGSYAVLAATTDRSALEKVVAATRHAAAATAALTEWRGKNDVYAIAMPSAIKFAQQQLLTGLAAGKAQIQLQGDEQMKAALAGLELYEALFRSLDREVAHFALGIRLGQDGSLHVVSRTLPVEGGTLQAVTKETPPMQANLLAGLPQEPFLLAGGGVIPAGMMDRLMGVSVRMMKMYPGGEQLTDEQAKKLTEVAGSSLKGLRSMAMLLGTGQGTEPLYGNTVFVMQVDNSKEYVETYARVMAEMENIGKAAKNPLMSYRVENIQIAGKPALKMTMNMSAFLAGNQPPEAQKMMELMFGPDKDVAFYIAVANPHTIVGAYLNQQTLEKVLRSVKPDAAQLLGHAGNKQTADMLPSGAQWVALWSPRGTLQFVARLLGQLVPVLPVTIPEFPETAPIGFAVKASPAGLDTDLAIPAEVLKAAAEVIRKASLPQTL